MYVTSNRNAKFIGLILSQIVSPKLSHVAF